MDIKEIAGKFLGQRTSAPETYDPSLLVAIPRNLSIEYLGTSMEELNKTSQGFDIWYDYEFRCLLNNGLPISAVLKFLFPHTTKSLVESKSLKLYLSSFANEKMGITKNLALQKAVGIITSDLTKIVEPNGENIIVSVPQEKINFFINWKNDITEYNDYTDLKIDTYNMDPKLLFAKENSEPKSYFYKYDAFKSNCRITNQPDYGTLYLYYNSKIKINKKSLIKYFASFYKENHFHEECLIAIFKHISELLNKDDKIFITILFNRRGSLDIAPCRYKNYNISTKIIDKMIIHSDYNNWQR